MVAVLGEPGSGKTLFARCIVDKLKREGDLSIDDSKIG
jgi:KaiC/GvpD/RAD55 family RecA-like ATPase